MVTPLYHRELDKATLPKLRKDKNCVEPRLYILALMTAPHSFLYQKPQRV